MTSGNANFGWIPVTDALTTATGNPGSEYFYPKCLDHQVNARSILEYPDGVIVARCSVCGDRVSIEFNEHSILLRRAHEIAIAVVEASEDQSINYVESYHRLKERVVSAEEATVEARILLDRIGDMLTRKAKGSLGD